jgi:septal ring factor EnvC (AmiA/AmiB activator)
MQSSSGSILPIWPSNGIISSTVLVPAAEYDRLNQSLEIVTNQNIAWQHSLADLRDEQENQRVLNQAMQLTFQTEIDTLKNNLVLLSQEKSNVKNELNGLQQRFAAQELQYQKVVELNGILSGDRASEASRFTIINEKLLIEIKELTAQLEPALAALSREKEDCAALRKQLQDCKSELRCVSAVHPTRAKKQRRRGAGGPVRTHRAHFAAI